MNKRGNLKHGGHGTLTYARWKSMMQRCNDPKADNFEHYGGRGVKVCERWQDFAAFLEDMGECPGPAMTLDRIKNSRGYEPGNCRWATQAQQNRNRSHCIDLEHGGVTRTIAEWARETGLPENTLRMRLRNGWSADRALTTPLNAPANRHPVLDHLTYAGETKPLVEWAAEIGMTPNALRMRLRLGWSIEKALTTPRGARG